MRCTVIAPCLLILAAGCAGPNDHPSTETSEQPQNERIAGAVETGEESLPQAALQEEETSARTPVLPEPTAMEDLEALRGAVVPFAEQTLARHGHFFPFAAVMRNDGEIVAVAAYDGEDANSFELITMLLQALGEQAAAGDIRAAALCYDVYAVPPGETEKTDAICVKLEHVEGHAHHALTPYERLPSGDYRYGEMFTAEIEPVIFTPPAAAE